METATWQFVMLLTDAGVAGGDWGLGVYHTLTGQDYMGVFFRVGYKDIL